MVGGDGNDTYVVDNAGDVVTEDSALVAGGVDLVRSTIGYVLGANVENLTLIGTDGVSGKGNALVNVITGNAGNNTLDGDAGVDALSGGLGDDRYVVDLTVAGALEDTITELANAGVDTVQLRGTSANATAVMLTLGAEFENLDAGATGTSLLNITGNGSGNVLTGNAANNLLDGGAGVDTLIGGLGNDNYIVDDAGDMVVEEFNGGTDRVKVGIATVGGTYILGEYIENATLISAVAFNLTGNALDNVLTGNASANFLRGGLGADTMVGRDGNDTYVVDNAGDIVTEDSALVAGGVDLVRSTIGYVLGANVENLTLIGTDGVSGRGNALANVITGNVGNNTLDGGAGADSLIGGRGDDTYVVDNAGDLVTEYVGEGTDRVLASISYVLGASLENLTLTGLAAINATGNALGNALVGNAGDNVLDGGVGADTMAGGGGNDTYMVDNAGDIVTETAANGTDRVLVSFTYTLGANIENLTLTGSAAINATGNALDNSLVGNDASNVLTGGAGNDTLAGGAGIDTLIGGTGDDVYVLDLIRTGNSVGWLDSITENSYEGSDTLKFVAHGDLGFDSLHPAVIDHFFAKQLPYDQLLYTGFENLDISETGTNYINLLGDGTDNTLIGNAADNLIIGADGDDVLDGRGGRDRLEGGAGYDVYYADVDGVLNGFATFDDVVVDSDGRGAMIVRADHDLGLTSRAKVVMNYSFDMLDGSRTGLNKLDFYGGDRGFLVIGNDAGNVISTGAGLYGAETVLEGRGGNDVLIGGAKPGPGPMKLVGGEGDDVFRFDYAYYRYYSSGDNIIVDFTSGSDRIALDFRGFNYFDTGILDSDMFVSESSAVAHDPNDYILYDTTTGSIYYDGDGSGFEFAPSEFAKVQNHAVLTADDFFLTGGPIYPV